MTLFNIICVKANSFCPSSVLCKYSYYIIIYVIKHHPHFHFGLWIQNRFLCLFGFAANSFNVQVRPQNSQ